MRVEGGDALTDKLLIGEIKTTTPMRLCGPGTRLPAPSARFKRVSAVDASCRRKTAAKAVQNWPCGMAASEEEPEALTEQLDVARRLENLPVSAWPPGTEPEPFQVGGGARPAQELRAAPEGVAGTHIYGGGARRSRALRAQPGDGAGALSGGLPG